MAIYLQEIRFSNSPLQLIRDAVFLLPADQPLTIQNSCPLKIIYLLAGHAALSIDHGLPVELHPGDTQIIVGPRLQEYHPLAGGESHLHTIILQFHAPPAAQSAPAFHHYLYEAFPESTKVSSRKSALLWNCIARLRAENEERPHLWHNVVHHLIEEAVLQMAELQGSHPARYHCPQASALSHYFGSLLEEFSCTTQLSRQPHALPRLASPVAEEASQQLLGMDTRSLYRKMQIESAKLQLVRSSQTMQVIARRSGFGSLATFYRWFTKAQGISPANHRKRYELSDLKTPTAPPHVAPRSIASAGWKILRPTSGQPLHLECAGVLFLLEGELTLGAGKTALPLEARRPVMIPARGRFPVIAENALAAWIPAGQHDLSARPTLLPPITPTQAEALREGLRLTAPTLHQRIGIGALTSLLWIAGLRQGKSVMLKAVEIHQSLPVAHAKEYIRKNHAQRIKLREIAWAAGVSEEHLARQFQLAYGQTVMNFLKSYRLQQSKLLLSTTQLPLDEIASRTGFSTTGLFCRAFKAQEKCTPGRWREKQQKR